MTKAILMLLKHECSPLSLTPAPLWILTEGWKPQLSGRVKSEHRVQTSLKGPEEVVCKAELGHTNAMSRKLGIMCYAWMAFNGDQREYSDPRFTLVSETNWLLSNEEYGAYHWEKARMQRMWELWGQSIHSSFQGEGHTGLFTESVSLPPTQRRTCSFLLCVQHLPFPQPHAVLWLLFPTFHRK